MIEEWDAYFENGQLANQTLIRGQVIPNNLYHLVVEVIVQHEDGSFLFMKRHPDTASYPNYYELTAGGSALKGETSLQAIQRELAEETGILADNFNLIHTYVAHDDACLFHCFYTRTACDKDSITMQKNETIDYRWVSPHQLDNFVTNNLIIPRQEKRLNRLLNSKR